MANPEFDFSMFQEETPTQDPSTSSAPESQETSYLDLLKQPGYRSLSSLQNQDFGQSTIPQQLQLLLSTAAGGTLRPAWNVALQPLISYLMPKLTGGQDASPLELGASAAIPAAVGAGGALVRQFKQSGLDNTAARELLQRITPHPLGGGQGAVLKPETTTELMDAIRGPGGDLAKGKMMGDVVNDVVKRTNLPSSGSSPTITVPSMTRIGLSDRVPIDTALEILRTSSKLDVNLPSGALKGGKREIAVAKADIIKEIIDEIGSKFSLPAAEELTKGRVSYSTISELQRRLGGNWNPESGGLDFGKVQKDFSTGAVQRGKLTTQQSLGKHLDPSQYNDYIKTFFRGGPPSQSDITHELPFMRGSVSGQPGGVAAGGKPPLSYTDYAGDNPFAQGTKDVDAILLTIMNLLRNRTQPQQQGR